MCLVNHVVMCCNKKGRESFFTLALVFASCGVNCKCYSYILKILFAFTSLSPPATKCLYQLHSGDHSSAEDPDGCSLVGNIRSLGGNDIQIPDNTSQILVLCNLHSLSGRLYCLVLNFGLISKNSKDRKIVLHIPESVQNRLPIRSYCCVVNCHNLVMLCSTQSPVEQSC